MDAATKQWIDDYIGSAPEAQQPHLERLYGLVRKALPKAEVVHPNGFPVWTVEGEWVAGFATRKKGPMLYIMMTDVLDRHADTLGRLRSGRSCIEYRGSKALPFEELEALAPTLYKEAAAAARG